MKCDDCLNLLEQYLDGEAEAGDAEQVRAHLVACAECGREFEMLTVEQDLYVRYDRELEIPPSMWAAVAARTAPETVVQHAGAALGVRSWLANLFSPRGLGLAFAGGLAVLLAFVGAGLYLGSQSPSSKLTVASGGPWPLANALQSEEPSKPEPTDETTGLGSDGEPPVASKTKQPTMQKTGGVPQSDILFREEATSDIEDRDTATHFEQAQNLLRSIRNIAVSDDDDGIDVSYEKAQSRKLLNENIVLRRDAEMAGKFPTKSLLGSLEPFLIDIANLPDKASPAELRQLKERVQRTEIVAALQSY